MKDTRSNIIPVTGTAGTIFFDASCGMCTLAARNLARVFGPRGFAVVPLQFPGAAKLLGLSEEDLLTEIKLLTPGGNVLGGPDALVKICRAAWWAWPLWALSRIPGVMAMLRTAYRAVARRRRAISRVCRFRPGEALISPSISVYTEITDYTVRRPARLLHWLALLPTLAALTVGPLLPAWLWMLAIAFSIWIACKWLTWSDAVSLGGGDWRLGSLVGYFLAWPGMDARPFLTRASQVTTPQLRDWLKGVAMTLAGAFLIWAVARFEVPGHRLLFGWTGMIGTVLTLHFGLFHLVAMAWRTCGFDVKPLMCAPVRAVSVADFWSRWNRGFRDLAYRFLFAPLRHMVGSATAVLITFVVSGLIHDLVISVPARAGYGLPTLYFTTQGVVVLFEKSSGGRSMTPLFRRLLAYVTLLAPLGCLFHPAFVLRVFVPFLAAIHAT